MTLPFQNSYDTHRSRQCRSQRIIALLAALVCFGGTPVCFADVTTLACSSPYTACLDQWKAHRVAFLKSETGYLNLAGLFWLNEGRSSFGSDVDNDIVYPPGAAAFLGEFELRRNRVAMFVNDDAQVTFDGERVTRIAMRDDTTGEPVDARHGSLSWSVIKRDDKFAVRLRDFAHPDLASFPPIDYFDVDPALRINATFHPYVEPRVINVGTVIEGLNYNPWSPGVVRFQRDDEEFELEAYDANGELFFVFGDQTSGRGTYPAGRFLYARPPNENNRVVLDFNIAQNPPCAYNDFATCPIASPRNRMATRIEAGERYDSHR